MAPSSEDNRSLVMRWTAGLADPGFRWRWGGALVLIAVTVLVYADSFHGPFIFDDLVSIQNNPQIRSLWPLSEAMRSPPSTSLSGRPLVSLSFALNYAISGLEVWSYHAGNLLIHLLNVLLVFALLRRSFRWPQVAPWLSRHADALAFAASLIWAVHPLNSETVVYLIQRTELMVAFFFLLMLYAAVRMWQGVHRLAWGAVAVASCAMGMACKEVMAVAPLVLWLYDRAFVSGGFWQALRRRKLFYSCLAATWLVLLVILLTNPRGGSVGYTGLWHQDPLHEALTYLRMQMAALVLYLRLSFWPDKLSIYHDIPPFSSWARVGWQTALISLLFLASLLALWRRPVVGTVAVSAFVILAPTSSIVPVITEPAAERRMYLPLICLIVLVLVGLMWLVELRRRERQRLAALKGAAGTGTGASAAGWIRPAVWGWTALAVLTVALGGRTWQRIRDYETPLTIWEAAVRAFPDSAQLRNILGMVYESMQKPDQALAQYRLAVELNPEYPDGHYNLGRMLVQRGDYSAARRELQAALKRLPRHHLAMLWLARLALEEGQVAEAQKWVRQAVEAVPEDPECYVVQGLVFLQMGQPAEAKDSFAAAVDLNPRHQEALFHLAMMLADMGRLQDAQVLLSEAFAEEPQPSAGQNYAFGALLCRVGQWDQARRYLEAAVQLDPGHIEAAARYAWILAADPKSQPAEVAEARQLAERLVQRTNGQHMVALDALGIALARQGRFDEAIPLAAAALEKAQRYRAVAQANDIADRLEKYQRSQPFTLAH